MTPFYLRITIYVTLAAGVATFILLGNEDLINNIEVIKSISTFFSMMSAIAVALTGLSFSANRGDSIHKARMLRAGLSCLALVFICIINYILAALSIHYVSIRIYTFCLTVSFCIATLLVVVRVALQSARER